MEKLFNKMKIAKKILKLNIKFKNLNKNKLIY